MSKKPDGYIATHPHIATKFDYDSFGITETSCRKKMTPWQKPFIDICDKGWQIKPVWLSTEPPMSKELVRELCLRARDFGKCQEAAFFQKVKINQPHFDIWLQDQFNKILPKEQGE